MTKATTGKRGGSLASSAPPQSPTLMVPLARMKERIERSRKESDTAYFHASMYANEFAIRLATASLIAGLRSEAEGHRYRLEATLARANGVGEWADALDDLLVGAASHAMPDEGRSAAKQLSETFGSTDWRGEVLEHLRAAAALLEQAPDERRKRQLRHWPHLFAPIRNKTAHGAPPNEVCGALAPHLYEVFSLVAERLEVFEWEHAYLKRQASGRYLVAPVTGRAPRLEALRERAGLLLDNGFYNFAAQPAHVRLISTDAELSDFYVANGSFTEKKYEDLSFITGKLRDRNPGAFLMPPRTLAASETEGSPALRIVGNVFSNIPDHAAPYITRPELEYELASLLKDDRRTVVTLNGRGGIGKTSLAIEVLHQIASSDRFEALWWFSARDIDLLLEGPKAVRQRVSDIDDIAVQFEHITRTTHVLPKLERERLLVSALSTTTSGPALFIFDNFETISAPAEVYLWLDTTIRPPNKILITTRVRDAFKADYPVEVSGMAQPEFRELVLQTARQLDVEALVTEEYMKRLFTESDGHPYVAKVMIGEVARTQQRQDVRRVIAGRRDLLTALFKRTYDYSLSPAAQRVFLTLCAWRSSVPELALEAVMLRPANERIDIEAAVDELRRSSMIEVTTDADRLSHIQVPVAAQLFGLTELKSAPMKAAIEADVEILQAFGATRDVDASSTIAPRVETLFRHAYEDGTERLSPELLEILEFVASRYPPAWLRLADYHRNVGTPAAELQAVRSYVQARDGDPHGWRRLIQVSRDRREFAGEMNAWLQLVELPGTPFREISEAAARFNYLLAERSLGANAGEKRLIATRLRRLLEGRLAEADATDLTRLGWLCVHLGDPASAREYGRRGAALDPENIHARRLLSIRD